MDLDGDGNVDVLSGSYSRQSAVMAGLFQVLWGKADGTFRKAEVLNGTDGKPLVTVVGKKNPMAYANSLMEMICTRVFAADLNDDGHLDLVAGNSAGSFYFFEGEGKGKFSPKPHRMKAGKLTLKVPRKSDPFLIDWDADGDLDLLSGSEFTGVYLAINAGSKSKPEFQPFKPIIKRKGVARGKMVFGDSHIKGPGDSARVCMGDVNGDGKLDIVVGDSVSLTYVADGVKKSDVPELLQKWEEKLLEAESGMDEEAGAWLEELAGLEAADDLDEDDKKRKIEIEKKLNGAHERLEALAKERSKIVREASHGFVWVYYQK